MKFQSDEMFYFSIYVAFFIRLLNLMFLTAFQNIPWDSSRGCSLQMADLEDETHCWCQGNSFVTGQSQDLVVIHDSVEGFNPHRIDITIQYNPFGAIMSDVGEISHNCGKQAILPFTCSRVDDTLKIQSNIFSYWFHFDEKRMHMIKKLIYSWNTSSLEPFKQDKA